MTDTERLHYVRVCEKLASESRRADSAETELRETVGELEKARALLQRAKPGSANPLTWKEWKGLAQGEPVEDPRLKEATALLARAHQFGVRHPAIRRDIGAFLKAYRAPAQPAMCRADVGGVPCGEPEPCAEHPAVTATVTIQANTIKAGETYRLDLYDTFMAGVRRHVPAAPEPVTAEQIEKAIARGVRDARIVAGDPVMLAALEPSAGQAVGFEQLWEGWRGRALAAEAQIAAVLTHAQRGLGSAWKGSTVHDELTAIVALLTTAPSPGAGEKR